MRGNTKQLWHTDVREATIYDADDTVVTPRIETRAACRRIIADHNGCIGIEDPQTTVPELVAALNKCAKTITHIASKPVESQCLLDWGNLKDACSEAQSVLAKVKGQPT